MENTPAPEVRTLLAYVSAGGAAGEYAGVIADVLTSEGYDVEVVDLKREKVRDLAPYANVVVGTGVRMMMVYRHAKRFLARRDLRGKRLAIYLASGMAVEEPEQARGRFLETLIKRNRLTPVTYIALPGKMPGGERGRLIDHTDPDAARAWAEDLAGRLRSAD
ncbi:MAG: hypothetical protein GF405_03155 [Candidatus Eisenbacteria bacterium]|nr:hypothetical protein [Candidatus Eisenbacteria bacterium]